ncbi:CvpA family protein [Entomospira culicis]|uniref:Colicin V production protein n=1 Tax=Entomospira culicis TaxID=2719989 RepID=A0A968GI78_9SPIO|nr:CvpA family protein [Entomospira culicis]NIZ18890.1 hypothetical protein [Entomospira culicis]NIZ69105.1 hypothetical protein [Entomospira culicis]WDI37691.1 CvpA family protein [Entomospira culicis]WDI39319.1 CvpA family protein [Entomospira culicis]
MSVLDIVFITIFIVYTLRGLIIGLVSSSISILSKAAALFLAVGATPYLKFLTPFWIFWSIIFLFLALTMLIRMLFLKKNDEKISFFDRILGAIIGLLDAVFVGGLIAYFMMAFSPQWMDIVEASTIGDIFASYIHQAQSVVTL